MASDGARTDQTGEIRAGGSGFVVQPNDGGWMLYFHGCGFCEYGLASFKDGYWRAQSHIRERHSQDRVKPGFPRLRNVVTFLPMEANY